MTKREPIAGDLAPDQALLALRDDRGAFALCGEWAGVRAILGSEPVRVAPADADPFAVLGETDAGVDSADADPAHPAVIGGGWFGWLGYGLGSRIERLPPAPPARAAVAPWYLAYHDHVVVFDGERWWFEALWTPERDDALRERLELWRERLSGPAPEPRPVRVGPFAPVAPGAAGHVIAVGETVERIAAGDLFQANVTMRIEAQWDGDGAVDLFARALPSARPRFGALFRPADAPDESIVSLSPERFLRRVGRHVETDPIKGTSKDPAALEASAKDAAEHVMIVDLMRNDLGRVCDYGSIVAHEPRIEHYANVFHMVSTVSGELHGDRTDQQLLRATFPPGSVTGAPKVQSMKTVARLESTARGVYTGAIGYASPLAGLELSVVIRTFEAKGDRIWIGAGGGIVADSRPDLELQEALTKAAGPIAAIGSLLQPPLGDETHAMRTERRPRGGAAGLARALDHADRPDPALGVFTTLLAIDGAPQHLDLHLARLAESLAIAYGARLPEDAAQLIDGAASTVRHGRARVRVEARPGAGRVTLTAFAAPIADGDPAAVAELVPFLLPGGLGPHKWIDRRLLDALAATVPDGAFPLLVDGDGLVLEGHVANVWIREGERLITPPADGRILAGVTRALMLESPGHAEEPVPLERLQAADEVLLTSAISTRRVAQ